jgi:serine/threonine-protein kinase
MTSKQTCPSCDAVLPERELSGLCPACLLKSVLEDDEDDELLALPERVAGYELVEQLGRGGMGVVFRARHERLDRPVALKMILAGAFASTDDLRRFEAECLAAAQLDHPSIVPVFEVGEHDGLPFYAMRLMSGGSLAERKADFRSRPKKAAAIVAEVARAIHHGHERGVLHRDLKPHNILLDADGRPFVGDFGVARRLDAASTASGAVVGTPGYMAPEQVERPDDVTTAADVYGLGAILYELLCGRPPIEGRSAAEAIMRLVESEPPSPRSSNKTVPKDIDTVCMKCLQRDPDARYESARDLAEDLERFIAGHAVAARRPSPHVRLGRWVRRNPAVASVIVTIAMLATSTTAVALSVAQRQQQELRVDVLARNAFGAKANAGRALARLKELAETVRALSVDPQLLAAVGARDTEALRRFEGPAMPAGFTSLIVLDTDGRWLAHVPPDPERQGSDLSYRDYFRAAMAVGCAPERSVRVSRAYRSEAKGEWRIGLSTPLCRGDGSAMGVLMGSVGVDDDFGDLQLDAEGKAKQTTVVVARRDPTREDLEKDGERARNEVRWMVLTHDNVTPQDGTEIESAKLNELAKLQTGRPQLHLSPAALRLTDEAHTDPVPGSGGRWLAGLAPVGGTPLVVIVQTRHDDAIETNERLRDGLMRGTAASVGGGALFALLVFAVASRRRD